MVVDCAFITAAGGGDDYDATEDGKECNEEDGDNSGDDDVTGTMMMAGKEGCL